MLSSVLGFFDIGGGEIILIMLVALLLFGGEKLPELARGLGKGIRDFKDASEGVKREITNQIDNFEAKKADQANANAAATTAAAETAVTTNEATEAKEPVEGSVPVAEIGSTAEVEPVKEETHTTTEPVHLKETPIEPQADAKAAHNEYKS